MIKFVKENGLVLAGIFLLFIMLGTCVNSITNKYIGESNVYEKQLERRVKNLKEAETTSKKLLDSLKDNTKKKDARIIELIKANSLITYKVNKLVSEKEDLIITSKKYTYKESSEYIAKEYKAPNSVSFTSEGVFLKDSIPNKIVATIIEKNVCDQVVAYTEEKVLNLDLEVVELNGKITNKDLEIKSVNSISKEKDEALLLSSELNKSLEKQNSSLKRGRFLNRLLIVAGIGVGILIVK